VQRARELLAQLADLAPLQEDAAAHQPAEVVAQLLVQLVVQPVVEDHDLRARDRFQFQRVATNWVLGFNKTCQRLSFESSNPF
jgi:hypothetical protein